jgi:hypothetical protein
LANIGKNHQQTEARGKAIFFILTVPEQELWPDALPTCSNKQEQHFWLRHWRSSSKAKREKIASRQKVLETPLKQSV